MSTSPASLLFIGLAVEKRYHRVLLGGVGHAIAGGRFGGDGGERLDAGDVAELVELPKQRGAAEDVIPAFDGVPCSALAVKVRDLPAELGRGTIVGGLKVAQREGSDSRRS